MIRIKDHVPLLFALCLLTFAAALPGINGVAIHYGDEALYMEWSSRLSFPSDFWIRTFKGNLHFHKPPPYNWFVALCYQLFGESLFAARLPSILSACAAVILTYAFALYLGGSKKTAIYSGLALLSSYLFYKQTRLALTDMFMSVGIFAGAFAFLVGIDRYERGKRPTGWFFLASVGVGLSGFIKGHVGTLLGALPIIGFVGLYWYQGKQIPYRYLLSPLTWLPALILCGWWYAYVLMNDTPAIQIAPKHTPPTETVRDAFLHYFETKEAKGRVSGGIGRIPINLFQYSLGYLRAFLPWSLIVLLGFFKWGKPMREFFAGRTNGALMIIAIVVPLTLLFSIVITQQTRLRYLLPAAPAIAVLAGMMLERFDISGAFRKRWWRPVPVTLILLSVYITAFVLLKDLLLMDPLQKISIALRERVKPGDEVWLVDDDQDRSVFASLMLGHPVQSISTAEAGELAKRIGTDGKGYALLAGALWDEISSKNSNVRVMLEQSRFEPPTHGRDYRAMLKGEFPKERYVVVAPQP